MRGALIRFTAALMVIAAATPRRPFPDRPPLAHTGGFGEPTCARCHQGEPLNDPRGQLSLTGFPREYRPGETHALTVQLRRADMGKAGFQVSVRYLTGERAGQTAGVLTATDDRATAAESLGVRYAFHTAAGTALSGRGEARWRLTWTAPRAADSVVAHVVANAANDDASELSDHVYADSSISAPAAPRRPDTPRRAP
ncbi:MAG TPA: choice-of-anchor V domain-containing protein [Gemmatimonadales bacterium]|nr:choice-of-anchor V domain-containing protein [Gemmatimonadales bacterium]